MVAGGGGNRIEESDYIVVVFFNLYQFSMLFMCCFSLNFGYFHINSVNKFKIHKK